ESLHVAEAYLEEHRRNIQADVLAMAADLNREGVAMLGNPRRFNQILVTQAVLRGLPEAVVFDRDGRILARSGLTFSLEFDVVPNWALEQADRGHVTILTGESEDRVRALIELEGVADTFLYVGRYIEP